jgi:hypothetical protein
MMSIFLNSLYSFGSEQITANKKAFSPNGVNYLYYSISQENIAKIFVYNSCLKKTVIVAETPLRYSFLDYKWYNDDLLEINVKTGSPGNFSIFYSVNNNKVSEKHDFPLAVDPKRYLVLLGQEDAYITDIFEAKHIYKLDLNFQRTAIKYLIFDLKNTYFDEDGNLLFKYRDTNDKWVKGQLERDTIKLR